ncbi:MAG: rhomboid family intramembrane serine protease [Pseudomonadota bacterium]
MSRARRAVSGLWRRAAPLALFVAALWAIHAVDQLAQLDLAARFGLIPRTLEGLDGVLAMPLLHGGWDHLAANTPPLAILGGLVLLLAPERFWGATAICILLGGALTWLIARPSVHIGASGLIFGWFGVLVGLALWRRSLKAILGAAAALALYGATIFSGLTPEPGVSIEGHAAGLAAGLFAAWRFGRSPSGADARPNRRRRI